MTLIRLKPVAPSAAITRLAGLADLSDADIAELEDAEASARKYPARREMMRQGQAITEPGILLSGWACGTHTLSDGRRQILKLILPGDLIGMSWHDNPVAAYDVLPLTEVMIFPAPPAIEDHGHTGLAKAYAVSKAWEEAYTLRHITRLGRLSAYERIADLLLEVCERLTAAGLTQGHTFQMPLTQETLADALGLTAVHVSRTMQSLRQDGVLSMDSRTVTLNDPARLAQHLDRRQTTVQNVQAR